MGDVIEINAHRHKRKGGHILHVSEEKFARLVLVDPAATRKALCQGYLVVRHDWPDDKKALVMLDGGWPTPAYLGKASENES